VTVSCEHDNELGIPENAVKSFDEKLLASKVGPCSLELDESMDGLTQIDKQTDRQSHWGSHFVIVVSARNIS